MKESCDQFTLLAKMSLPCSLSCSAPSRAICSCLPQSLQCEELAANPTLLLVSPIKRKTLLETHCPLHIQPPCTLQGLPSASHIHLISNPTVKSMLRTNSRYTFRTEIGINSVLGNLSMYKNRFEELVLSEPVKLERLF